MAMRIMWVIYGGVNPFKLWITIKHSANDIKIRLLVP